MPRTKTPDETPDQDQAPKKAGMKTKTGLSSKQKSKLDLNNNGRIDKNDFSMLGKTKEK